jgi:hypothetical protein
MLFCDQCQNWFHDSCVAALPHQFVPANWGYQFVCGCCNGGTERFAYIAKSWEAIIAIAMFNCHLAQPAPWLHVHDHVCKFIAAHFASLAFGKKRQGNWQSVVNSTLAAKPGTFTYKGSGGLWKLVDASDPSRFMDGVAGGKRRIAQAAIANAALNKRKRARAAEQQQSDDANNEQTSTTTATTTTTTTTTIEEAVQRREAQLKRRRERDRLRRANNNFNNNNNSNKRDESTFANVDGEPVHGSALAGAKAFRSAEEEAAALVEGAAIRIKPSRAPEMMYWEPEFYSPDAGAYPLARVAKANSAPQCAISKDGFTVSNDKGYRLARASHAAVSGRYYYEVQFLADSPADAHIRVGFATQKADQQAPCGYDAFGYAIRDIDGAIIHRAARRPFAARQILRGDVVGCLIELPVPQLKQCDGDVETITDEEIDETAPPPPPPADGAAPLKTYYDHSRGVPAKPPSLIKPPDPAPGPVCAGSSIRFYLNGEPLRDGANALAFQDIHCGLYYPAVSCFNGAKVRLTFGPESFDAEGEEGVVNTQQFRYPPNDVGAFGSFGALARTFFKQNHRAMTLHKMRQERRARIESERLERAAAAARAEMQEKAANAWKTETSTATATAATAVEVDPQEEKHEEEEEVVVAAANGVQEQPAAQE